MTEYKKVRSVTLPTLSLKDKGTLVHVLFESAFREGKQMAEQVDAKGKKIEQKAPAHVANIINLDTGEEMQIVGSKVLRGTLEEEYPEEGYVGRCFEIENLGKHAGGRATEGYNIFRIVEVENPGVHKPAKGPSERAKAKGKK